MTSSHLKTTADDVSRKSEQGGKSDLFPCCFSNVLIENTIAGSQLLWLVRGRSANTSKIHCDCMGNEKKDGKDSRMNDLISDSLKRSTAKMLINFNDIYQPANKTKAILVRRLVEIPLNEAQEISLVQRNVLKISY